MWVDICGLRSGRRRTTVAASRSQELKASLDVRVAWVKLGGALVSIKGIGNLVVA
jgi:hypothetical protein